jgi:hypothetical protein
MHTSPGTTSQRSGINDRSRDVGRFVLDTFTFEAHTNLVLNAIYTVLHLCTCTPSLSKSHLSNYRSITTNELLYHRPTCTRPKPAAKTTPAQRRRFLTLSQLKTQSTGSIASLVQNERSQHTSLDPLLYFSPHLGFWGVVPRTSPVWQWIASLGKLVVVKKVSCSFATLEQRTTQL